MLWFLKLYQLLFITYLLPIYYLFITFYLTYPVQVVSSAADSSDAIKRAKEDFRKSISSHIVACLNPYRKPDCKLGRITTNEDFKHLVSLFQR